LSSHWDFQLQNLVLALKMEIFVEELEIISSKECRNAIVVRVEVRGNVSVGDCGFALTVLAVVVVEISMGGMLWSATEEWDGRVSLK
jgi:hypothetical protein